MEYKTPPFTPIRFAQALHDFFETRRAERYSPCTLSEYGLSLRRLQSFLGADPYVHEVTPQQIVSFLNSLTHLSGKSLLNVHTGLSSFWTWSVVNNFCPIHVMRQVARPRAAKRQIKPFTRDEVLALIRHLERSRPYQRRGQRVCTHAAGNYYRNRFIILCLLDTGLRASELYGLKIEDYNQQSLHVLGKGSKERSVPISRSTQQALKQYLALEHPDPKTPAQRLLLTRTGKPLNRCALGQIIERIAARAKVANAHPHRFRHTFAINYLRNGGDIYTLRKLLGHATFKMVEVYLDLAQDDLVAAHRRASPVKKWRLT
jgi:site-specific recombinase XerD